MLVRAVRSASPPGQEPSQFMELQELRKAVGDIMTKEQDVSRHAALIGAIPDHTIRPLRRGDPRKPEADRYNSFGFALDLADSERHIAVATHFRNIHADNVFVIYLLKNGGLEEVQPESLHKGDIVIYFHNADPTHAGKIFGDRVISKWGLGNLWEHALFEIPASYGTDVRYFRALGAGPAETAFLKYAQSRGVQLHRVPGYPAIRAKA